MLQTDESIGYIEAREAQLPYLIPRKGKGELHEKSGEKYQRIVNLYTPGNLPEQELIEGFVVRQREFLEILKDLKSSTWNKPEQHYIIQGPRGSGKTTLLYRVYYELKNDQKLKGTVLPIIFNEEQYHVRKLSRLWESLGEYLEDIDGFEDLRERFDELWETEDFEERSFEVIVQALKRNKKKLVLFLDNIGDMLNKFSEREVQQFREILLTSPDIRVIGASAVILEHTYDYSKPFFDFFQFQYLKGLTSKDTLAVLLHLSEKFGKLHVREIVENQPGRVETLRRLTGGVLRTIILLFKIFADEENGDSFRDLETAMDRVTPLYKYRMDDLSPQQQEIVDAIAIHWDAVTTKEISKKVRMESKAVSSQLKQLEKSRIIHKIETNTKNHLYQITERFFNIWYLMRCGRRRDKNRVQWLVQFLRTWCNEQELVERARRHMKALSREGHYPKHAFFMSEALAQTQLSMDLQHNLLSKTREFLKGKDESLLKELSFSDRGLFEIARENYKNKKFRKCLKNLEKISRKSGDILGNIGLVYHAGFQNIEKAEEYYLMAVGKGSAGSMKNLADLYIYLKKNKGEAVQYARKAYENLKESISCYTFIFTLLWSNKIEEALPYAQELLADREYANNFLDMIRALLMLLIAKKQYYATLKFFKDEELNLKERLKPVYYALMWYMREEHPNEIKKVGGEIKETVEEIIKAINQLAVDYA